jgi:hypothetical protein
MAWGGNNGRFSCNITYNGEPAVCYLHEVQNAWKFSIYDGSGKYIVQYKFRDVSLTEAQTKAEYIVNMEP